MSKKVALMCGHGRSTDGSWDPGTAYGGNNEAALMLPITKSAVKYLRKWGVKVISDADKNNNRNMIADVKWANKWGADIYVSIHCDWYKAPSGVMPLYVSSKGKKLATALNKSVKAGMGMKSRGVVRRTDLYELNVTDCPACILETGSIKADIKMLKNKSDAYGKAIAKGICNYLGVKIPTTKKTTTATTNKKKVAAKPATKTTADKIIDACKAQAEWMKNFTYKWESNPTIEKSKKRGTCVTYTACVLQRVGLVKSGKYIWHDGKGYGKGKVYGDTSKFKVTYMGNKTFKQLKDKLKMGDVILCDDNKSGKEGSGGHVMIFSGKWTSAGNPRVYDQNSATFAKQKKKSYLRTYDKNHKILAICRAK